MLFKKTTKETVQLKMIESQGRAYRVRETKLYFLGILIYEGYTTITELPDDF